MGSLILSEDILAQARGIGGEINTEFDRQTTTSETTPWYTVVGRNSKDSSYAGVLNGKTVEVSRAGEFRRKNGEGGQDYFEALEQIIILDARTANTLFEDNKPACRAISTKGMYGAVVTEGKMGVGTSCDTCPYNRFVWDRRGGKEGRVWGPNSERPLTKEDLCTSSLQLWCHDVARDENCIVQFSAGAIRSYRDMVREVEAKGVKLHSILWRLSTEPRDNGPSAAPTFIPKLEPVRVLSADEFDVADTKRLALVAKAQEVGRTALPVVEQAALPAASAFDAQPTNVGPAADDNDPFSKEP
jgi:hypothetical protein